MAVVRSSVYLAPGVLYAGAAPGQITTVLGSCVAVCLWSPRRIGGMNHFLLPRGPERAEASMRFGDTAMELLMARMAALGCGPLDLEARIYGGASTFRLGHGTPLGVQNVMLAQRWLSERGIAVIDQDVLGNAARRVQLDLDTGRAAVTRVGMP